MRNREMNVSALPFAGPTAPCGPASAADGGFVPLYRRLYEDPDFRSPLEASIYVYLFARAAWRPFTKRYGAVEIQLQRGDVIASLREIEAGFGMSRSALQRFFRRLETGRKVGRRVDHGVQVIKICDYDVFCALEDHAGTPAGQTVGQRWDSGGTHKKEDIKILEQEEQESLTGLSVDAAFDEAFERWWAEVPRKVAKGGARKAYRAALKKATAEQLLDGIKAYAASCRAAGKQEQFIVHPATWLNQERWGDSFAAQVGTVVDYVARSAARQESLLRRFGGGSAA